ncbi:S24 family peptidase [Tenacibaculum finnmarkense genomovar finnmarkense]|uniref:S24 family peptidase n=1 Tax=Tenacibaculum finnmarkense TaxID=2781243 RepID=UPI001EFAFF77|nr:S24 family peptidase [Tenacibaculum finnmarkense]MCG8213596.1 S24 family peptidase [Tenacibaculum finnmarkense genomovar finnmarkense]MCG8231909.1 S24 family peptidase [Tenacibaculum finnmarkense genomovar finnmarkense]MCG8886477.1 S24 family peptidase [Tenacibaculum finnmarkense]MCG8897259.1 S24 family peptidase [Tenacibaculum finnmarkense]MCG8903963.1 S24 family peptidase [Tenacibaculum finnmarkense]
MTKKEHTINKIIDYVEENNVSAYSIAQNTKLSEAGIGKILNKSSKNPRDLTVEAIYNYLFNNYDLEKEESATKTATKTFLKEGRPFYDVDFELGFKSVDNDILLHPEFNINFPPANRETINWYRGKGNSMLGEINSGDYIALEEIVDFSWFPLGRIYGVVTKNGFRTIKRVVKSTSDDKYLLVSSNPDKINYPDQDLPKNMISKLFKVVFTIKDLDE